MGFNLSTTLPSGVVVGYYQVRTVQVDVPTKTMTVTINQYVSTTQAQADAPPANVFSLQIQGSSFLSVLHNSSGTMLSALYTLLESLPQFSGCTDNGADYTITQ